MDSCDIDYKKLSTPILIGDCQQKKIPLRLFQKVEIFGKLEKSILIEYIRQLDYSAYKNMVCEFYCANNKIFFTNINSSRCYLNLVFKQAENYLAYNKPRNYLCAFLFDLIDQKFQFANNHDFWDMIRKTQTINDVYFNVEYILDLFDYKNSNGF